MTDPVALVSVASSGLVAVGGLWVSYRSGRDQRKHEALLAYEERAWEKKSEGLFSAIAIARSFIDTLRSPDDRIRESIGVRYARLQSALDELVPVIEAYASKDCRRAFDDLRAVLLTGSIDLVVEMRVQQARHEKEQAIDAMNFEAAAAARDRERWAVRTAAEGLGVDQDEIVVHAERLIDAARASVRGEA